MLTMVEWVRAISGLVGIAGAVIVAPKAISTLWWETLHPELIKAAAALRPYRQHKTDHSVGLSDQLSFTDDLTVTVRSAWGGPDATDAELIELLRQRTDSLQANLDSVRQEMNNVRQELTATLNAEAADIRADIARLRTLLDARERAAVQIDAAGFPVIAIAFVLAGLPDSWVRHSGVAVPAIAVAAVITVAASIHAVRMDRVISKIPFERQP